MIPDDCDKSGGVTSAIYVFEENANLRCGNVLIFSDILIYISQMGVKNYRYISSPIRLLGRIHVQFHSEDSNSHIVTFKRILILYGKVETNTRSAGGVVPPHPTPPPDKN